MGQLLLKYALCIAWIKCNDYLHIAEAAGSLFELIDSGYASKLPALYLALARAYFALNRFALFMYSLSILVALFTVDFMMKIFKYSF